MNKPNLTIRKAHQLTGHRAAVYALGAGEGENHVVSAAGDGWIVRWDLDQPDTGRLLARVETQVFSLLPAPDLGLAIAGNMNGGVHWVDLRDPSATRNVQHHRKGVFALLRRDEHLYSAGGAGLLTRWSMARRRAVESVQLCAESLRALAFHPARGELAVGASDNAIYLLDADTLAVRHHLPDAHDNSVFCLQYHPEQPLLLSGGRDAQLKAWSLAGRPELLRAKPAHWFTLNDIAFHPSQNLFATASRDKTVKLWDAESLDLLKVLDGPRDGGHLNSVNCLFWHPSGEYLLSGSDDRTIIVWALA